MVVGCVNASTKVWLQKQVEELAPTIGVQLIIGHAHFLVKMIKLSAFVPKTMRNINDVMIGVKHQSGLDTDNSLETNQALTASTWLWLMKSPCGNWRLLKCPNSWVVKESPSDCRWVRIDNKSR